VSTPAPVPKPDVSRHVGVYSNGADVVEVLETTTGVASSPGPDEGRACVPGSVAGSDVLVRLIRDAGVVRWLRVSGIVFGREEVP
jgi:hypothetical protein